MKTIPHKPTLPGLLLPLLKLIPNRSGFSLFLAAILATLLQGQASFNITIAGAPEIFSPPSGLPILLEGTIAPADVDVRLQWLAGDSLWAVRDGHFPENLAFTYGMYCLTGEDHQTGYRDTACVRIRYPLVPCGKPSDDPPGCLMCGPVIRNGEGPFSPDTFAGGYCGPIENSQWFTFRAVNTWAPASLVPIHCQLERGVQLMVFDQDFQPFSHCLLTTGEALSFEMNGLDPGKYYHVMVDGIVGDVCDWEFQIQWGIPARTPSGVPFIEPVQKGVVRPGTRVCYQLKAAPAFLKQVTWQITPQGRMVEGNGREEICIEWEEAGTARICARGSDICFPTDLVCLDVAVHAALDFPGGEARLSGDVVRLFPVPAADELNVTAGIPIIELEILDSAGNRQFKSGFNAKSVSLDTSKLPPGAYFLKIRTTDNSLLRRFVKK